MTLDRTLTILTFCIDRKILIWQGKSPVRSNSLAPKVPTLQKPKETLLMVGGHIIPSGHGIIIRTSNKTTHCGGSFTSSLFLQPRRMIHLANDEPFLRCSLLLP